MIGPYHTNFTYWGQEDRDKELLTLLRRVKDGKIIRLTCAIWGTKICAALSARAHYMAVKNLDVKYTKKHTMRWSRGGGG